MGNGTRHLLGAIAGIVAIPVVFALVFGGLSLTMRAYTQFLIHGGQLYAAVGILAVGAVVLALLVGTRISPLASLIPGLVFTAAGGLAVGVPTKVPGITRGLGSVGLNLGATLRISLSQLVGDPAATGTYTLVGVLLVVASIAPSRWRAKVRAAAPGTHRAAPAGEEPWPPAPPVPSDPAQQRATPPLPSEEAPATREYPYGGSGPQAPYGGSGPQTPYGGSGPQAPYEGSGPQTPYGGSGPQAPYGGSDPQTPYGASAAPPDPFGASHEPPAPYGASAEPPASYGAGAEPQGPYRSAFEPPASQNPGGGAGGDVTGYAQGYRPSSWSGPQAPYPAEPGAPYAPVPGRPARPAGDDPYAAPAPPHPSGSAFAQPAEPWGPPPGSGQPPPTRAFSTESDEAAQADPTPRTMPDANANDDTHRIPWSEADQARFRDRPER